MHIGVLEAVVLVVLLTVLGGGLVVAALGLALRCIFRKDLRGK